jgi:DNA-binding PadR family transcriptional regulator
MKDLSVLEQHVMLAILRKHPDAYGISIQAEIKDKTGREHAFGSIYACLERLEENGFVASREGEATAVRGGKKKLHFTLTGVGRKALQHSLNTIDALRADTKLAGALA